MMNDRRLIKYPACLIAVYMLITLFIVPQAAFAYSYGDPSKEDIAEAYLLMHTELGKTPPNWEAIMEQYLTHKQVLQLEFGDKVVATLDANLTEKKAELFEANYKSMLVMNVKRRLDNANKEMADYAKAKLLLAKAKGTFDVLVPFIKDTATMNEVDAAFQKTLDALGNPGLFGVGKKEASPEELAKQSGYIYKSLEPLFPFVYLGATDNNSQTSPTDTANPDGHFDVDHNEPSKVSPVITIIVIGVVLVIGGMIVYFGLRKGWFKF